MAKRFVLDTNVLLCDPDALFAFGDNEVVIPIYVLEELDTFKSAPSALGWAARTVTRTLDSLREQGSLNQGVPLEQSGGTLRVTWADRELPDEYHLRNETDNRILATALQQNELSPGLETILVTRDVNLRVRADGLGLTTEDYETDKTNLSDVDFEPIHEVAVSSETIDGLFAEESTSRGDAAALTAALGAGVNEFVQFNAGASQSALTRVLRDARVAPVRSKRAVWGLRPRNREQSCALDLLLDPEVKLVSLVGKAGTGKTLLAIAAGLHQVAEEAIYSRVLVSRPIVPMGRDLGYLPGDIEEKVTPWMQPIFDNLDFLMSTRGSNAANAGTGRGPSTGNRVPRSANGAVQPHERRQSGNSYQELIEWGILQVEPLTYIRGRSIPSQFMIVDEAQNLTPHEVKTIITRAAEGTKLVLTGDPYQIDNPYVNAESNGLVHAATRFKGSGLAGMVTLVQGERSELAEEAAQRL